ncbi:ATP-binding cassette domain-containing protein [Dactylosporangium sp. CS-047395]|uniref:ATP-binding cassette domain-containing protein n=1 Tax=Dactylosporangium sp. CS-047395 TaxID=3239936 RepID=UPI003D9169F1
MPIRIAGARVHNLKDVTLTLPESKITVFVGVSGSGKSSIVFDTVAVESQRQLNASYSWFIRNQLPKYERPQADAIEGLTTAVIVDQQPIGGNSRSTVGTITDVAPVLRALFARHAEPTTGLVSSYSFNDPRGMCPECEGMGRTVQPDVERMLDKSKSLNGGAILLPTYKVGTPDWQILAGDSRLDADKPLRKYTKDEWHTLLHGTGGKVEVKTKNATIKINYEGLVDKFVRLNLKRDTSTLSEKTREAIQQFMTEGLCPLCHGARLSQETLNSRIDGRNIAEMSGLSIDELIPVLAKLDSPIAETARTALERISGMGLGYLTLDRPTVTLSGGEGQRLKMVRHLGSTLTHLTYIFDEPSVGLHPRDVGRLNELLKGLRDKGNTVLVVEHDPDVIDIADHVVEVGPGAGGHGGEIVFEGTVAALAKAATRTATALGERGAVKKTFRKAGGQLSIKDADLHNLKNVSVDIPTGVLTAVTGVAGSGKTSLISGVFAAQHPAATFVDQGPITASSRSNPATYLELMDGIRKLFAKASGQPEALFSFNSKGACEECQGRGVIITEIAFMDPVTTHCETCHGRRFKESVLEHQLRGKSIADVLELPAEEAVGFFTEKALKPKLQGLVDVGLGYLTLGQPLSTLSGGERQRIKLATQLHRTSSVYVLDEPTTGLHMADVGTLMALLNRIVDDGNTVVVIEHNLDVVRQADWVIDLGPDGGAGGGEVVFTGTPKQLLANKKSVTGEYLRKYVG